VFDTHKDSLLDFWNNSGKEVVTNLVLGMSGYGLSGINNLLEIIFFCSCLYFMLTQGTDSS
jgi:hypothetical protein